MSTKPVLVFDVNETLLDLEHLAPLFSDWFGRGDVMREWFAQLILYSQTLTITGIDSDFKILAGAVLRMIGTIKCVGIGDADVDRLFASMGQMPAHPDAAASLAHLRNKGFRMVTLTNSPPSDGPSALEKSGLADFFEQSFSVQPTGRFKPAPQTYRLVSDALDVPVADLCLVACHVWDTIGLQALGGTGALVTHGFNAPLPVGPQPDLVAGSLTELAHKLSERWPEP